ncbi:tRNA/rRNA methyltransferase [Ursidibacter maritimus]|uniref:tRNA/rRNA methyltransferase n=1 Tax=Ursidibacter maritimus TaxID=1331689 RepID=A0A949WE83_9PAST|nr:tRNA/rRNA methyltransferase [Ursidibacter maritimus]KAE9540532.1 rRNA methyltransferase [Ursidibacter maritimus]MBV6524039.1 tRNA/rRNA methyltransferase [Ursidibacter maritimus]MBV6525124.1 tRNA/rRNA methyltransferase [Ursidibacter maritimus]MBV6527326.1 tRNA/rRNA methyltransferase [Ursidibacter maritimus]MBV6528738.1 tRNA/rRNA methyltransferase [Ursidibacter maritimus]
MNNKFQTKSPRFKSIEERREPTFKSTRTDKNTHRDTRNTQEKRERRNEEFRRNERGDDRKPKFERSVTPNYDIYPTEGKRASGEGSVKISVKGGSRSTEKKTGPLSPRAPEKIRNNRATEMKVYGENACHTLFQQRPDAIVRLWATVEGAKKAGELLSYLAEQKKAYHVVDSEEMERVTGTEHHGGICLLAKKSTPFSLEGYLQIARQRDCLVLLDGVNNAQNVGGIMRTCAFYGVKGIIVEQNDILNSSNAARVAEGGLEFVHPLETKHRQIALAQLRNAGYQIVHLTRQKQAQSLSKTVLNEKIVFVLSEVVANDMEYPEDTNVQLSFANPLNSGLNVAVNTGILLAQWYQSHIL